MVVRVLHPPPLKAHSGHKVPVLGQITLPVRVGECTHQVTFVVVKQGASVLEKGAYVHLGLVSRRDSMNVNLLSSRGMPSQI